MAEVGRLVGNTASPLYATIAFSPKSAGAPVYSQLVSLL